ncbi:Tyrosine-protein phosphatase Lar, partial [Daphnia magna]
DRRWTGRWRGRGRLRRRLRQRSGGAAPLKLPDARHGVASAHRHPRHFGAHRRPEAQRQPQVFARVRVDRDGPAVHVGALERRHQQAEEPLRQRGGLRPFARRFGAGAGRAGQRLHQRQLVRRLPQAGRVRGDAGPAARVVCRLLAHVLGAEDVDHRHDDAPGGAGAHQVRPVLARPRLGHVRRRQRHDHGRAGAGHLLRAHLPAAPAGHERAPRGQAAAVHGLAGPRRARPPGALPAVPEAGAGAQLGRLGPHGGALQRRRGSHGRLHRHRLDAGAAALREHDRRVRPRDGAARPAQLHGPNGGPVHLHSRRAAGGGDVRRHGGAGPFAA